MEIFPNRSPEIFQVIDRPLPEFAARLTVKFFALKPPHVVGDVGLLLSAFFVSPQEGIALR